MATPDGIKDGDWKEIEDLARTVVDASAGTDNVLYRNAVDQVIERLRILQARYGPLPSILATIADYTEDDREAVRLLETAYFLARERGDARNMTYIASSIAQRYVEDLSDFEEGKKWTDVLRQCLKVSSDPTEVRVLAELEATLQ